MIPRLGRQYFLGNVAVSHQLFDSSPQKTPPVFQCFEDIGNKRPLPPYYSGGIRNACSQIRFMSSLTFRIHRLCRASFIRRKCTPNGAGEDWHVALVKAFQSAPMRQLPWCNSSTSRCPAASQCRVDERRAERFKTHTSKVAPPNRSQVFVGRKDAAVREATI
jgi:hypothetical protein